MAIEEVRNRFMEEVRVFEKERLKKFHKYMQELGWVMPIERAQDLLESVETFLEEEE